MLQDSSDTKRGGDEWIKTHLKFEPGCDRIRAKMQTILHAGSAVFELSYFMSQE